MSKTWGCPLGRSDKCAVYRHHTLEQSNPIILHNNLKLFVVCSVSVHLEEEARGARAEHFVLLLTVGYIAPITVVVTMGYKAPLRVVKNVTRKRCCAMPLA